MKRTSAAFLLLILAMGVLYGFFIARELFFIPQQGILPSMLMKWHNLRALASAMEWVPRVMAAVILIVFGLSKEEPRVSGPSGSLLGNSGGMLVLIVVAAAGYSALAVFGVPEARKQDGMIRRASAAFEAGIKDAEKAIEARKWDLALEKLEDCAIIDRNDKRYVDMKGRYDRRPGAEEEGQKAEGSAEAASPAKAELSANQYYLKALELKAKGDLYTAHSYATKAFRIDPRREDAQRLASEIWNAISTMQVSQTEQDQRKIAIAKMEAYKRLEAGDPLDAYARFLELKKQAPDDADIDEYIKQSLEEAKSVSFFKDEVTRLSRFPSARGLFFRSPGENSSQYFLACRNAYFGTELAYLSGVECLVLGASGNPRVRLVAPYAKLQGSRLLLACYDRNDPSKAFLPSYRIQDKGMALTNFIDIPFTLADLKLAAVAASPPGEANILELEAMRRRAARIGADPSAFINEALMRIEACLAFLLVSMAALYLGYRFRYRGAKRPILSAILAFPLAILVAGVFLESWDWLNRTVMTALIRDLPSAYVAAFAAVQALALALAFIVLAGYRDAPSD